ncbi:MAG: acyl-CoA dehydrogenase [Proteobacteria bacterium]|nr:acyl-CoA dehydrogenase [Pseudomonadota bacterium]
MLEKIVTLEAGLAERVRAFVKEAVIPKADSWEVSEKVDSETLVTIADAGFMGVTVPECYAGLGISALGYGQMVETFSYASPSLATLFTVHSMVTSAILQWGTEGQKREWLPQLASGQTKGAFCLTEDAAGSNAAAIEARLELVDDTYILTGEKKWVTFGQIADLYLVFAKLDDAPCAFLVPASFDGVTSVPVTGMSGLRAAMLANVSFDGVRLGAGHLLGRRGAGLSQVAALTLAQGRFSVAWTCVGILHACCAVSRKHTFERHQLGNRLSKHQLVQQLLARMYVGLRASRDVCLSTTQAIDRNADSIMVDTCTAKYLASTYAVKASRDAVQLQGAVGCRSNARVQQLQRDAALMEIIEGTTQILETIIGRSPGSVELFPA